MPANKIKEKFAQRRTKIVATLGPSTDDAAVLESLIKAGVDVLRVNFSHGAAEHHKKRIHAVRAIAEKVGRYVGIMGDLAGSKIRIESFANGPVTLSDGQAFTLDTSMSVDVGDENGVSVAYPDLVKDVNAGDLLLLDDGQIVLRVETTGSTQVHCSVVEGGLLSEHKGLNKQGGGLSAPVLTDKDRVDIKSIAELGLDFMSVSFAREARDIEEVRSLLEAAGGHANVVAKIERAEAVRNIESIIDASDIIMVARGDLAVEVGYAAMTSLQKRLIHLTRSRNKISITATQMLESMIKHASPTRAEASDVANAVMDGTDAVMLSAETAIGEYPVQAVTAMGELCLGAEKHEIFRRAANYRLDDVFTHVDEAIAMAVMYTANHLEVSAIVALTESGSTSRWMSRVRSSIPIYAFTRHVGTRRRVALQRGVYPVPFDVVCADPVMLHRAVFDTLFDMGVVSPGDLLLLTKGEMEGVSGGTNTMQILRVPHTAAASKRESG